MLVDRVHTNAAEQRRFLAMSQQEQMLEIWLNGRETNGHVADLYVWKEKEVTPQLALFAENQRRQLAETGFIQRWGARGTALLVLLVMAVGALLTVLNIIDLMSR